MTIFGKPYISIHFNQHYPSLKKIETISKGSTTPAPTQATEAC